MRGRKRGDVVEVVLSEVDEAERTRRCEVAGSPKNLTLRGCRRTSGLHKIYSTQGIIRGLTNGYI